MWFRRQEPCGVETSGIGIWCCGAIGPCQMLGVLEVRRWICSCSVPLGAGTRFLGSRTWLGNAFRNNPPTRKSPWTISPIILQRLRPGQQTLTTTSKTQDASVGRSFLPKPHRQNTRLPHKTLNRGRMDRHPYRCLYRLPRRSQSAFLTMLLLSLGLHRNRP
jgi:hypothetical protein